MGKKIYLIAGEASGDLHGSALIRELKALVPALEIRGWGGDLMQMEGCQLVKHYRDLAFMGFVEVLRNYRTIRANFALAKRDIQDFKPDLVVFIDYPGFNMRLLPWVRSKGIKTVYYIAPQAWAWHKSRVKTLRKYVDRLLVILPFEEEFFRRHGVDASYVGHPLIDSVERFRARTGMDGQSTSSKPIIALLPGSRRQEVGNMLPVMLMVARQYSGFDWVVAMAPGLSDQFYHQWVESASGVRFVRGQTYDVLAQAHAALVTSGTATLETALFGVPQVVLYKANALSVWIARALVHVRYISLVNLLLDRPLVDELIQGAMDPAAVRHSLDNVLGGDGRRNVLEGYEELSQLLGKSGASANAAKEIGTLLLQT